LVRECWGDFIGPAAVEMGGDPIGDEAGFGGKRAADDDPLGQLGLGRQAIIVAMPMIFGTDLISLIILLKICKKQHDRPEGHNEVSKHNRSPGLGRLGRTVKE